MHDQIYYLVAVLGLGLAAQWIAWRWGLPAILVLLLFGGAAGWVFGSPDHLVGADLLLAVVSLSVAVVLFEGGLSLRFRELKGTGRAVLGLVTAGIAVTWLLTAAFARWCLGMEPAVATLLGAVLVVSGPTVIVPLLRQIRPSRRVASVVKWEGILNDPIGAVLAFIVSYGILIGGFEQPALTTAGSLAMFLVVGALFGLIPGAILVFVLRRYWIPDFLQNMALLTAVVLVFAASNHVLRESGLVAVTVLGVVLANQKSVNLHHVIEFKENLRTLLISCLFIVLASRIQLPVIAELGVFGGLFLLALVLVVRPAAAMMGTIGSDLNLRERLFLCWMAPRGIVAAAVSSVFALELKQAEHLSQAVRDQADLLAAATFLVIVGTVAVYGLTAGPLARRLGVAEANPQGVLLAGAGSVARELAAALRDEGFHVLLVDTNQRNLASARMAGMATCWANILSEYAREEIDFSGIGRLLAVTPNDEVNLLAMRHFELLFGRSEVYRLPVRKNDRDQRMSPEGSGRTLFRDDATYWALVERLEQGAVLKKTRITQEFGYAAFREMYGPSAIVLFVIDGDRLGVVTADRAPTPKPGQTLVSLVDPAAAGEEAETA